MKGRSDQLYIYGILQCCEKLETYLDDIDRTRFDVDPTLQVAVVRNIEIIGEAAKGLSQVFRDEHSNIPWKEVMRMRDKIIRHYFRIDPDVVWQTATSDIPALKTYLLPLLITDNRSV